MMTATILVCAGANAGLGIGQGGGGSALDSASRPTGTLGSEAGVGMDDESLVARLSSHAPTQRVLARSCTLPKLALCCLLAEWLLLSPVLLAVFVSHCTHTHTHTYGRRLGQLQHFIGSGEINLTQRARKRDINLES